MEHRRILKSCIKCGKEFMGRKDAKGYCSLKCQTSGNTNPAYKSGRIRDNRGYVLVKDISHPFGKKKTHYIYEHRLIVEKQIGRYLHTWEQIHHIDFNPENNSPDNLTIMSKAEHHKLHAKEYWSK